MSKRTMDPHRSTQTSRIVACLQRVAEGDAPADVADDLLILLTGRNDAGRVIGDKRHRRLCNILRHHSKAFDSVSTTVAAAFEDAIIQEGMTVSRK